MLLYNLFVRAYGLLIRLAAFKNQKAGQWVQGRNNWRAWLQADLAKTANGKRIWVHCASYGEFEQGRPLMEAIKKQYPQHQIVLSFFSPSGYEAFKTWSGAEVICYLPLDTRSNARDFIELVKPDAAIFIKYEFWVNFLFRLRAQHIPTFLVSAVFKPHHPFFKWYGGLFRRSLLSFKTIFVQDEASARLLKGIGITNCEVCGDTRFDRVVEIRSQFSPLPFFETYCRDAKIWVAGSSWPGDEELLLNAFKQLNRPDLKLIIAPHNVDEKHINGLKTLLEKSGLSYSLYSQPEDTTGQVLVVDRIGLLSRLYYYADVTYVGGGFDSGIHNCLEPAVFLKPVLFYNHHYQKYNEVVELVKLGAAKPVSNADELRKGFDDYLTGGAKRQELEQKLQQYIQRNSGVTQKVLQAIRLR